MAFVLEEIVPWGRSFDEYLSMFALTGDDLERKIVGCGDGPASFNAGMKRQGRSMVSVDPLYHFSAAQIARRIDDTYPQIVGQLHATRHDYIWTRYDSPEALGQVRMAAMQQFLADFAAGKQHGRYVAAELPQLPFAPRQFELALCSHLLFLYSDHLSLDFHRQAIAELCRVADEVRIFPLVTLAGARSAYVEPVLAQLAVHGLEATIERVPFEFQRGGNEMLRICPSN